MNPNRDMFVSILGRNSRRVPAQFGNKKNDTAPRRISLSRFNFHDRNKRESKEDTVVYINELKQDGNSGLCFILLIAILRALVC